jgi:hypothetical protein
MSTENDKTIECPNCKYKYMEGQNFAPIVETIYNFHRKIILMYLIYRMHFRAFMKYRNYLEKVEWDGSF